MKFAYSWLREWVDTDLDAAALADRLTLAGHEVDGLHVEGTGLDGIIVGDVLEVTKHPDADRLRVCTVDAGTGETINVVCGAPNARAGIKSPLALPGTKLPNGVKLRRSKIRGVESQGMLCSAVELCLGDESDGIIELPADARPGQALSELLRLPDTVFDLDLTPNRGDCFSVLGIARDVAALTGAALTGPALVTVPASCDAEHPVELVDGDACPRFAARVVRGIDPSATSPQWMTERLRRSGLRSISPVVDVTNYVMLELGQPLHAYDLARLTGPIRPRFVEGGESLVLLDDREIELDNDTVAITDDSGPIGLAGIMGGLGTAVTTGTRDVFLEAAFWPQAVMAGRARRYGLHTDASLRFERGVDPELPPRAIERATELLLAIAGGNAGPTVDHRHAGRLPKRTAVSLRRARLARILGVTLDDVAVTGILRSLGLAVDVTDDGWQVTPPGFRFDIVLEEDLVEEVARIYGYDRIPEATAIAATSLEPVSERQVETDTLAAALVARDYQEVITYSFVEEDIDRLLTGSATALVLSNPISSEMSAMRGTLWTGMLQAAAANVARQQDRVRLFEIGKSFHGSLEQPSEVQRIAGLVYGPVLAEQWGSGAKSADFFDLKADLEALLTLTGGAGGFTFEPIDHAALQPGQAASIQRDGKAVGVIGKLHPSVAKRLDLKRNVFLFELDIERAFAAQVPVASPISKFPAIRRDIAIVVKNEIPAAQICDAVVAAIPGRVREVRVFDVYRGPGIEAGLKSIALGLILQETSRTLTDEDADSAMNAAVQNLQQKFAAVLRD